MIKKIIVLSMFLVLFMLSARLSLASTVLFQDNFDDGDANGWTVPRNTCSSSWAISSNKYGIIISSSCITEAVPSTLSIPNSLPYSFELDMTMTNSINMDRNFVFKYQDSNNWYDIHTYGNMVHIQKVVGGLDKSNTLTPNPFSSFSFQANQTYHFRIEVFPTMINLYINGGFNNSVIDPAPYFPNSSAGLQASAGSTTNSQVWFDNVVITQIDPPTPTPVPTATPSPSPTPIPTIGPFELPIDYPGRPATDPGQFKSGFWSKLNAAFDHYFSTGLFIPFTGNAYLPIDCPGATVGIKCYDSHNGTDFSRSGGTNVLSTGTGIVYYTSPHTYSTCTTERGGFGCVAIVGYPGNNFGLFAHLSQINVLEGQPVNQNSILGVMGETGCPGCGVHLHFGVLKPVGSFMLASPFMSKKDWQGLLSSIKDDKSRGYKPSCTYRAPNNISFSFQDPSGWKGAGADPWSLPKTQGGCGVSSPYLWKYDIGSTP